MSKEFGEELPEPNRHTMIRYLLGELPQPWQEHFEEQFFTSDKHFANLKRVEDQLVDDYVSDTLSPEAKARFESHFLNSERRKRKVQLARILKEGIEGTAGSTEPTTITVHNQSGWRPSLAQFSIAAAALLLVCVGAMIWRSLLSRETLTVRNEPAVVPPISGESPLTQRSMNGDAAGENAITATPPPSESPGSIVAVTLTPGVLRDLDSRSVVLSLNQRTAGFRIQIPMTGEPEFEAYKVEIRTPEGKLIRTFDNMNPAGHPKNRIISFVLLSQAIRPGDYLLTLSGKASGNYETVDDFQFRVVSR